MAVLLRIVCSACGPAICRAAGVGAFWATDHPFNISEPLRGDEQTNNRAELTASLRVLQLELHPVEVRSDSAYVVAGVTKKLPRWRATNFYNKSGPIKSRDLWMELDHLLSTRDAGTFLLTKVRGHTSAADVLTGRVTLMDKIGNDNADALAVAGTHGNSRSSMGGVERHNRILTVKAFQCMMIDITMW